jgi:beta-lactam-binding protein with PASTA domain
MKITTFDPVVVTSQVDDAIKVFEDLGFEKKHAPETTTDIGVVVSNRMKHAEGYHVDVVDVKDIPRDQVLIRMNVDNFQEAYDILIKHGFKNQHGDETIDKETSKAATMVSPSGFMIGLVEHFKK